MCNEATFNLIRFYYGFDGQSWPIMRWSGGKWELFSESIFGCYSDSIWELQVDLLVEKNIRNAKPCYVKEQNVDA